MSFNKQYVITARAKGLNEWRLLLKYPVRMAINPLLSSHRLGAAWADLRGSADRYRPQPADGRSNLAAGHAGPGYVPGGQHRA
jgi:hypothetical protein